MDILGYTKKELRRESVSYGKIATSTNGLSDVVISKTDTFPREMQAF